MKFLGFFKSFIFPQQMVKFKSMNIIIAICIFVITSFLLGLPVGQNKINSENDIQENYNYNVLKEIPDTDIINNVIAELVSKECSVYEGKELTCANLSENLYENDISFVADGITKKVHFVIDIFDIEKVYLEIDDTKINYDPKLKFTTEFYDVTLENVEYYLVIISSDSLYFQAHPFGTNQLMIEHNERKLRTDTMKIFYQNNLSDFAFNIESPEDNGHQIGEYLYEQLIIGNINTLKLKSFTLSFLVGVLFTLITVLMLWVFFRRNGKIKSISEYYNIGAIASLPISLVFFILLWFIPNLIYIYIFVFSLFYLFSIYIINTAEDLV